jgi:transcriptional regulator with XRE-family HTH domain
MRSTQPTNVRKPSSRAKEGQLLSKSMEKTFRRYQTDPKARRAFTEVEAITSLANQIRVIRNQRGWTQKELARRLGTTQTVVSRLEDPSYGRISFKTFVALAHVFDVAPVMKFESTVRLLKERWTVSLDRLEVPSFEEEAVLVAFSAEPSVHRISAASGGNDRPVFHVAPESTGVSRVSLFKAPPLMNPADLIYVSA